jgi:hypothetical protein
MSAVVIPFKGKWQGSHEAPAQRDQAAARAFHDARLIRAAKCECDDWTGRLLLALLETLTPKQLTLLEFRLLGPQLDSQSALQALAIVQLVIGDKYHRERIRHHLDAFAARDAE